MKIENISNYFKIFLMDKHKIKILLNFLKIKWTKQLNLINPHTQKKSDFLKQLICKIQDFIQIYIHTYIIIKYFY